MNMEHKVFLPLEEENKPHILVVLHPKSDSRLQMCL